MHGERQRAGEDQRRAARRPGVAILPAFEADLGLHAGDAQQQEDEQREQGDVDAYVVGLHTLSALGVEVLSESEAGHESGAHQQQQQG
ncbi:MAG: hypothetical protein L0Z70_09260 [Chloroflexi bacterium]|nr:hypothetical protein [Chloroflexota bacterium]